MLHLYYYNAYNYWYNNSGNPLRVLAIIKRNIEAQRLLIRYGSDINLKDLLGFTALHVAVATQQEVSVKILMDAGAAISIKENMTQMNPYQYAEALGLKAALPFLGKYLEEHGKYEFRGWGGRHHIMEAKGARLTHLAGLHGFGYYLGVC